MYIKIYRFLSAVWLKKFLDPINFGIKHASDAAVTQVFYMPLRILVPLETNIIFQKLIYRFTCFTTTWHYIFRKQNVCKQRLKNSL